MTQLAGFCHYAPPSLIKIALAGLQTSHWDHIPASETLAGGTRVAARCAEAGREDLESAHLTNQRMVAWLEICVREGRGLVRPQPAP
jgi:hypothetical protein